MTTSSHLQKIRERMEKATQGPWYAVRYNGNNLITKIPTLNRCNAEENTIISCYPPHANGQQNREYVASLSPSVVQQLILEIMEFRKKGK